MTIRTTLAAIGCIAAPALAAAQPPTRRTVPEVRVDAFASDAPGAQFAAGMATDLGAYVRLALLGGIGAERRDEGGAIVGAQRVEGVARFHLDPFRQASRGVYFGGGLAVKHVAGAPLRPLLVGVVGIEGRRRGAMAPAFEAGVGGGIRVGVALRGARRERR